MFGGYGWIRLVHVMELDRQHQSRNAKPLPLCANRASVTTGSSRWVIVSSLRATKASQANSFQYFFSKSTISLSTKSFAWYLSIGILPKASSFRWVQLSRCSVRFSAGPTSGRYHGSTGIGKHRKHRHGAPWSGSSPDSVDRGDDSFSVATRVGR